MFEFHDKVTFNEFRGLFNRGRDEACPSNYLLECKNMIFEKDSIRQRYGSFQQGGDAGVAAIVEFFPVLVSGTNYYLYSVFAAGVGQIYYTGYSWTIPIGAAVGWTGQFSAVQIGTRIYIVFLDGVTGVLVFDISWTAARAVGCTVPAGAITAGIGGAGNIERGSHVLGVVFETNTGFISTIGGFVTATVTGAQALNLSTIPTGPSHVTKRHLVATKALFNYNGDPNAQEYFFIPNGTINDNVTTVLAGVNFYDTQLVDSADRYVNQLTTIPSCRRLTLYNSRLVAVAPVADRNTCYISQINEPESVDAVDGILTSGPPTYRGIEDVAEIRGNLYIFRDTSTQVTVDNGEGPSTWKVETVDKTQGIETGSNAIFPSTAIAYGSHQPMAINDNLVIKTTNGIKFFNGSFSDADLSYAIKDEIAPGMSGCIALNIHEKYVIYGSPAFAYYGDFSEGFTPQTIKWSKFAFDLGGSSGLYPFQINPITHYLQHIASSTRIVNWGQNAGAVDNDTVNNNLGVISISQAISSTVRFSPIFPDPGTIYQFNEIIARVNDADNGTPTSLDITLYGPDDIKTLALAALSVQLGEGKSKSKWFNFVAESCSVKLTSTKHFNLKSLQVLFKALWNMRPHI